jgi:L,D-transpeptidase ErfK/SrfK
MATKMQMSPLSRTLMLLCVGTGLLLLGAQRPKLTLPNFNLSTSAWTQPKPAKPPSLPKPSAKLVVDLSDRKVYVYKDQKLTQSYGIAIGQEGWETPVGSFRVFQKYHNPIWQHPVTGEKIPPGQRNPLGKWWIGFYNHNKLLIGFHGTTDESLIGAAVSHGCLRMKNADIETLAHQVDVGTPVSVRP